MKHFLQPETGGPRQTNGGAMKLHELVLRLRELVEQATPGQWKADASIPDDVVLWAPRQPGDALLAAVEAAALKRNVAIYDDDGSLVRGAGLVGEWICIPREDFDRLRAALEAEVQQFKGDPAGT